MLRYGRSKIFQQFRIGVLGAPFNQGQTKLGVKDGPQTIRNTGFIKKLEELGHDVVDAGDVQPDDGVDGETGPSGEKNHRRVLTYNQKLSEAVRKIREDHRMCITLGGDHSIAIGSVSGHCIGTPHKQLIVLWVDAHADINTGRTSPTGNMHGMPISFLVQELKHKINRLPGSEWPQPSFEVKHLAYIGLRDVDTLEQKYLDDMGILHFGMRDLDKIGLSEAVARCLDHLQPTESRSLHVSFDIDVLDPFEAPSTGTPVRGGLSLREGLSIVEEARNTGRLRGFDLVEVNPTLGTVKDAALTAEAAKAIILSATAGVRG
ncbi:Arginase-1 [Armadillidium nasatum]|uniref:Arginase n=1 Tax=Armadillidium nasatum TaxID=96803 RepID=A0A5N5TFB5_9CRUS|nr:Arginase-1 [Armadillidium nasatum]